MSKPAVIYIFYIVLPCVQIAREAEAAMFHRQMFEELRRITHLTRDPTETIAIGAVEASFKCCASAIIVLTKTGRCESKMSILKWFLPLPEQPPSTEEVCQPWWRSHL